MEVIVINGSPKKNGNNDFLAQIVLDQLQANGLTTRYIKVREMKFEACIACDYCNHTGHCFMKDEMAPVYEQINQSVGTIVLTPVFFDGPPARLKGLVDRTQSFYASKYVLKKPSIDREKKRFGLLVSTGGQPPYHTQFQGNDVSLRYFFKCINTKLLNHLTVDTVDDQPVESRGDFLKELNEQLDQFCESVFKVYGDK